MKKKIKKLLLDKPIGSLVFYWLRILREKIELWRYNDFTYITTTYKRRFKREINLVSPKCYTEKLQWLKLFYRNDLMPICSDKFAVRSYIFGIGMGWLLNDLLGVYDNANEIDFDSLPQRFVAKANHGSGWNLICKNKNDLDWAIWKRIMNQWLKLNLYVFGREWNYKNIIPRIIIEKFIDYNPLIDYKFMCFNGEPKFIQINHNFADTHYVDFYNMDWEKANFTYRDYQQSNILLDKPIEYDRMVEIARILSKPFPFVRIDLYNFEHVIILGELTFFPGGGMKPIVPVTSIYDELFGSWIQLPEPNFNLDIYAQLHGIQGASV